MKKVWYIIVFIGLVLGYLIIRYLIGNKKPNNVLLKYMAGIRDKRKQKVIKMTKKIAKLEQKKVSKDAFKDYSHNDLVSFINRKLKLPDNQ